MKLKAEKIGTYVCFQETYDPVLYKKYHPAGTPKADYDNRVTVFDRAMEAGISDVGLGVLFGLADYRFEVLALMEHARHLEEVFGCGPHTISVPRIEPADNAPLTMDIPNRLSDDDFKKIVCYYQNCPSLYGNHPEHEGKRGDAHGTVQLRGEPDLRRLPDQSRRLFEGSRGHGQPVLSWGPPHPGPGDIDHYR